MLLFKSIKPVATVLFGFAVVLTFSCGQEEAKIEPITELRFDPGTFEPDDDWNNKTVLLEYFGATECPPCLDISMATDGLLQAFDKKYLAILEYHVNIAGPDPMENRYSHLRRFVYDVYRAPMTFFDGEEKYRGGGEDSLSYEYFQLFSQEIAERLKETPETILSAKSTFQNDSLIVVDMQSSSDPQNVKYLVALVEKEVEYLGKNRVLFHKMVVRDLQTAMRDESGELAHTFNVNATQEISRKWLEKVEEDYAPFTFKEKRYEINRNNLQVIFFAQDSSSLRVYNAFVSEIK